MHSNRLRLVLCGFVLFAVSSVAWAQSGAEGSGSDSSDTKASGEPMSLEESRTEVTTEEAAPAEDEGGFWIFPKPAPLTGRVATDRPAFSNTATLVPRGRMHIEGGYTFTYDREDDKRVYDHRFGELMFRTGLTDWLEFRVGWNGGSLTETMDRIKTLAGRHVTVENHNDGWEDMSWGVKLAVLKNKEHLPNLSFIYQMGLPTGSGGKSADDVTHFFGLPWNYAFCKKFTAYGSLNGAVQNGSDGQFFQGSATVAGAYHVMDNLSLYLEYLGKYHNSRHGDCAHILSAGPIWWITDNFSVDLRASLGLNEEAPDFQTSVGFGLRF